MLHIRDSMLCVSNNITCTSQHWIPFNDMYDTVICDNNLMFDTIFTPLRAITIHPWLYSTQYFLNLSHQK
jgi:hypothetical protein